MMTVDKEPPETKCGFVALIGAPNAGKSTLVNQLVGQKVAIVTHKVQTTRARLRGIALQGNSQIVLVDTPGIFEPARLLDRAMVAAAWEGAGDADQVVLVADARQALNEDNERIIKGLKESGRDATLVLNKIDLVKREGLLDVTRAFTDQFPFKEVFFVSAQTGDGVEDLKDHLAVSMPDGPWLYPEDQIADLPQRMLAAEVTREKAFLRLHQELPYASTVETESWTVKKDGSVRIEQVIFVERESQRKIVLGKAGQTIKAIGAAARKELEKMLNVRVHLFLFVKVREKWGQDPERFRQMGLELPLDKS